MNDVASGPPSRTANGAAKSTATGPSSGTAGGTAVGGSLRVALVGAGHIASAHLAAWHRAPGAAVVAVADRDREAARRLAARHRIERTAGSLDELLADADVVDLCTPPSTHFELARTALEAGRHLLVEKPLVTRIEDWEELEPLARRGPGRLAVLHNLKFSRGVVAATRWIERGRIGRPLRLRRRFLTAPASDRMLAGGAHWSHALPGGRWFETLPHELYLIHALVGPLELEHAAVRATPSAPAGAPADEVVLTFGGADRLATVEYSAHCRLNRRTLEIVGTEGEITVDLLGDSATCSTARDSRRRRALGGLRLDALYRVAGWLPDRVGYLGARLRGVTPHARLIDAFARHLLVGAPAPTPLSEIDYVIRQGDRVARAIEARLRELGRGRG